MLLSTLVSAGDASAQDIVCVNTFGGTARDEGRSIWELPDGSLLIGASSRSYGPGDQDYWPVWTDSCGVVRRDCTHGGVGYDPLAWAEPTSDGNIVTIGAANMATYQGLHVAKLDSNCNVLAGYAFGYPSWGCVVHELPDQGFIAGGNGLDERQFLLVRLDASCNQSWWTDYGSDTTEEEMTHLAVTTDGGYIMTGQARPSGGGRNDGYVIRTDASGNVIWERTYCHLGGNSAASHVVETEDGCFVVAGYAPSPGGGGDSDVWLFKVCDADSGAIVWDRFFGDTTWNAARALIEGTDQNLYVTGITGGITSMGDDSIAALILCVNRDGDSLWTHVYDDAYQDAGYHINQAQDGDLLVTGISGTGPGDNWDVLVMRVTPAPLDTLWIETADLYYGPEGWGCSVPVNLSNCTEIGGVTIPLRYDPLPAGWACDSVSFVGGRMEGWEYTESTIDPVGRTVLIEGVGITCLPPDSGALFYVWFSHIGGCDSLLTEICVDTTTIDISPSPRQLLLVDCASPAQPVASVFVSGCFETPPVSPDVTCDSVCNVLDVVRLVNVAFRGTDPDEEFCPYGTGIPAGDLNCNGAINVLDVVLGVNCAFRGDCSCACGQAPMTAARLSQMQAVAAGEVLQISAANWEYSFSVATPVSWSAAQLEFEFPDNPDRLAISSAIPASLTPYWHLKGRHLTVGLIDIYGETIIEPGQTTVLHLSGTGEFPGLRLASGLLATQDAEPILISPAELAGADAVVKPSTFALGDCYPNPFNTGTVIPYTLAQNSRIRLEVFDVLGRCVASLVDEPQSAGQYDIPWNGLDDRGRSLASGMYFYRLTAGDLAVTKKMVLLK